MPLKKFTRYAIELPDGSRTQRKFRTKTAATKFKKLKKIKEGKVVKQVFRSVK
jgi:hypothetical protein